MQCTKSDWDGPEVGVPSRLINPTCCRFWVLETVARVPYFAFISVLHLYETLGEPAACSRTCDSRHLTLAAHVQ